MVSICSRVAVAEQPTRHQRVEEARGVLDHGDRRSGARGSGERGVYAQSSIDHLAIGLNATRAGPLIEWCPAAGRSVRVKRSGRITRRVTS